jgi:hypothetical protein
MAELGPLDLHEADRCEFLACPGSENTNAVVKSQISICCCIPATLGREVKGSPCYPVPNTLRSAFGLWLKLAKEDDNENRHGLRAVEPACVLHFGNNVDCGLSGTGSNPSSQYV